MRVTEELAARLHPVTVGELLRRTEEPASGWTFDECCVCGGVPDRFGLVLAAGTLRRIAWCDALPECETDRDETNHLEVEIR